MQNQLKGERNHTLNYLKALACFCVVMLHCGFPGVVGKLIYGPSRFAVPLFFMISGYFVYCDDKDKVIKGLPRKIKHIAKLLIIADILYFFWHIIQHAFESGFIGVEGWFLETFTVQKILKLFVFQTTLVGDVSWFLVALLICYAVTYLIAKNNLWKLTAKFIPILLIVNITVGEFLPFFGVTVQWYWCSNFWVLGFPFYAMGYWIRINEQKLVEKVTVKSTCLLCGLSFLVVLIERIFTTASQLFMGNILVAVALFLFCIKYPDILKKNRFIENIGEKYSFLVYILHPIIRDVYRMIFEFLGLNNNLVVLWIRPIVVFSISIFAAYYFKSVFDKKKL